MESDYQILREFIGREPDAHVRRAFVRIVHRIRPEQQRAVEPLGGAVEEAQRDLLEDVWAEATEEIIGILVHELSPLVGSVRDAARTELRRL